MLLGRPSKLVPEDHWGFRQAQPGKEKSRPGSDQAAFARNKPNSFVLEPVPLSPRNWPQPALQYGSHRQKSTNMSLLSSSIGHVDCLTDEEADHNMLQELPLVEKSMHDGTEPLATPLP